MCDAFGSKAVNQRDMENQSPTALSFAGWRLYHVGEELGGGKNTAFGALSSQRGCAVFPSMRCWEVYR